jgi:hypothetical protein
MMRPLHCALLVLFVTALAARVAAESGSCSQHNVYSSQVVYATLAPPVKQRIGGAETWARWWRPGMLGTGEKAYKPVRRSCVDTYASITAWWLLACVFEHQYHTHVSAHSDTHCSAARWTCCPQMQSHAQSTWMVQQMTVLGRFPEA